MKRWLSFLVLAFASLQAAAHVGIARTLPDHDAVLDSAPSQLYFEFGSEMTITNVRLEISGGKENGKRINVRLPRNSIGQSTAFGAKILLDLPALLPGTYLVYYQAITIDGHVLVDDFTFSIKQ